MFDDKTWNTFVTFPTDQKKQGFLSEFNFLESSLSVKNSTPDNNLQQIRPLEGFETETNMETCGYPP